QRRRPIRWIACAFAEDGDCVGWTARQKHEAHVVRRARDVTGLVRDARDGAYGIRQSRANSAAELLVEQDLEHRLRGARRKAGAIADRPQQLHGAVRRDAIVAARLESPLVLDAAAQLDAGREAPPLE